MKQDKTMIHARASISLKETLKLVAKKTNRNSSQLIIHCVEYALKNEPSLVALNVEQTI